MSPAVPRKSRAVSQRGGSLSIPSAIAGATIKAAGVQMDRTRRGTRVAAKSRPLRLRTDASSNFANTRR